MPDARPPEFKISTELSAERVEQIRSGIRTRETTRDPERIRGIERIELEVVAPLEYRGRAPAETGVLRIGEPVERGGSGEGNSPLVHFLSGAASCLLNQFIRVAIADDLPVAFRTARSRGAFRRDRGGGFTAIRTEIFGTGTLPTDGAQRLVERAESLCYVHNTLARAAEMTTVLVLDDHEVVRRTSRPTAP